MSRLCVGLVLVCLATSEAYAQQGWHAVGQPSGLVPVQSLAPQQQQVQVQVGQQVATPPMPSPPPMPVTPPTYEGWRDGWRESWVHEFRPLRNETSHHHDGWFYNERTGNYQRNIWPQQQACQPQCVYPQYYNQPTYYYQYRQPCSIWPW